MRTFARTAVFSVATFGLVFAGATINPVAAMASCGQGGDCATNGASPGGPTHGNAQGGHLQANFGPFGGTRASGTQLAGNKEGVIDPDPTDPVGASTFTVRGRGNPDGTFTGRVVIDDPNGVFGGVSIRCSGRCTLPSP